MIIVKEIMIYLGLKSITKRELQIENSILSMFYIILLSILCMYITYMEVNEILTNSHTPIKTTSSFTGSGTVYMTVSLLVLY